MANLYDKAGLVNIPVGYQDGFLYNIKPEDNTLGFRFNRDSAATRVNKKGLIEQVGYFGPELVQNGDFSQLGPELIVNGDFATDSDWVKGPRWSISGGKAICNANGGFSSFRQTGILTSGKIYKITLDFDSSGVTSGSFKLNGADFGNASSAERNIVDGTNVFYVEATSNSFGVNESGAVGTGILDNVSVKQVDPNDYWTLGTGWSIQSNYAQSTALNTRSIYQNIGKAVVGKKYKVTYTILETNGGNFKFVYGGVNGVIRNSIGTYTENIVATSNADANIYFDALNVMIGKISNLSVTEVLGDKPRIDYTDSLTSPSFLLEPQSTNLITYSEDIDSNGFSAINSSIQSNVATSPDGTLNADLLKENTANDSHFIYKDFNLSSGQTYTISVFAKSNGVNRNLRLGDGGVGWSNDFDSNFDLTNGTASNGGVIQSYGNGWYRCSVVGTTNATASRLIIYSILNSATAYQGDGASGVFLYGLQIENLPYASSYIPTAGSTVTRNQETCVGAGNVSTFNSTEGVLYAEIAALSDDLTFRLISLSDGTNDNIIKLGYRSTSNQIYYEIRSSGSGSAFYTHTVSDITSMNKVAVRFEQNNFSLWINGIKVSTDTSGNTPNNLSNLNFTNFSTSASIFYGKVKGVYVFNEALTDDELQQLTT